MDLQAMYFNGDLDRGLLRPQEHYWRDNYDWFLGQGYRLRPRYHPDWVPSWKRPGGPSEYILAEDGRSLGHKGVNDATRVSDGAHVVLKRSPDFIVYFRTQEASIMEYFSQENLASHPRNHCVPCLDVLRPPTDTEGVIIVMPILRSFDKPDFDTVGEVLDFVRQVLVGFEFLHEHRVAHRDVRAENIMMDGTNLGIERFRFLDTEMCYDGDHLVRPKKSRTASRPKYYITDFGFSSKYEAGDMPPREPARPATDASLPELGFESGLFNPFPIDVYYVGNFIRMEFMDGNPDRRSGTGREGFEFLRPLITAMTLQNPDARITMTEAVQRFDKILSTLNTASLRAQATRKYRPWFGRGNAEERMIRSVRHWYRRLKYTILRRPPVPVS